MELKVLTLSKGASGIEARCIDVYLKIFLSPQNYISTSSTLRLSFLPLSFLFEPTAMLTGWGGAPA